MVTSDWQVYKLIEIYPQAYSVIRKYNISTGC